MSNYTAQDIEVLTGLEPVQVEAILKILPFGPSPYSLQHLLLKVD